MTIRGNRRVVIGTAADPVARMDNDIEAHALLDLIDAEFQSDPNSQACFDSRIVSRVHLCVTKNRELP